MNGEAEYLSWNAELRTRLGAPLPACHECGGKGEKLEEGTNWICGSCVGTGVQMTRNEFKRQSGWKLHDCPDGHACRAEIGGGCASGWCAHFGIKHETLHNNIVPPADGVEEPRKKRQPNRGEDEPWANEDLEVMRQQAKDTSLAAKQGYIHALEYELQAALTRGVAEGVTSPGGKSNEDAK